MAPKEKVVSESLDLVDRELFEEIQKIKRYKISIWKQLMYRKLIQVKLLSGIDDEEFSHAIDLFLMDEFGLFGKVKTM